MTDKSTIFDFKAMFQAHVDANPKIWDHDRASTLGASEAFGCLRKAWFDKHGEPKGYEQDAGYVRTWGAAERGNIMEEHWVVPVLETQNPEGTKFHFGSDEDQVTYVYGANSATPDGLYTGVSRDALKLYGIDDIETDCFLLEIKSVDPRTRMDEEKEIHHGQVQQQMGVIRSMTPHKPMYTVILYINASFYDEISVFVVRFDPDYWRSARIRAKQLNAAEKPDAIYAEGILMNGCDYCRWTTECAKVNKAAVPTKVVKNPFSDEDMDKMRMVAKKERAVDAEMKKLKDEKDDLRSELKMMLSTAQTKKAGDETFKVSWSWQDGRETLDTAALEADGIDLTKYKKKGNGFEKITISVADEG